MSDWQYLSLVRGFGIAGSGAPCGIKLIATGFQRSRKMRSTIADHSKHCHCCCGSSRTLDEVSSEADSASGCTMRKAPVGHCPAHVSHPQHASTRTGIGRLPLFLPCISNTETGQKSAQSPQPLHLD
jgi:hypothetical protein